MATYKHLRSSTANKRPTTSITDGQLAINTNTASPGLFFKDSAGTGIVKVGPVHVGTTAPNATPAAGGSSGNYLGEQWLDTSVSPAQMKVWNGSAWVGIVADELPVSKLQDGAARQLLQTDAAGTGVEWSNTTNLPLGTAAAPAYRFQGDPDSGLFSPGANQVAVATNGAQRLTVDTAATTSTLPVVHPLGAVGTPSITFTGDLNTGIWSPAADTVAASTAGTERLRITSAGLVGIGTSAPETALTVGTGSQRLLNFANNINSFPSIGTASSLIATTGGGGTGVYANFGTLLISARNQATSDSQIAFLTGTNERLRINSAGNVGIGTTSPQYALDVSGSIQMTNNNALRAYNAAGNNSIRLLTFGADDNLYLGGNEANANQNTIFRTSSTERARIDSSGRLLVGTASDSGGALFQVNGNRIRVATAKTPASAADTGTAGEVCWDADYIYVCTATNTWKRTAISTW
jgi:hypothetical protein